MSPQCRNRTYSVAPAFEVLEPRLAPATLVAHPVLNPNPLAPVNVPPVLGSGRGLFGTEYVVDSDAGTISVRNKPVSIAPDFFDPIAGQPVAALR